MSAQPIPFPNKTLLHERNQQNEDFLKSANRALQAAKTLANRGYCIGSIHADGGTPEIWLMGGNLRKLGAVVIGIKATAGTRVLTHCAMFQGVRLKWRTKE